MKKTLTFAFLHFNVAFLLGYLLTGDFLLGSLIAMIEPLANTVVFYFHEKFWQQPRWRTMAYRAPTRKTVSFALFHFGTAFFVTYLLTGSPWIGGLMATIEPSVNTLVFHLHEKWWIRFERTKTPSISLHDHHKALNRESARLLTAAPNNTSNTSINTSIKKSML